jgi:hypothetical protein
MGMGELPLRSFREVFKDAAFIVFPTSSCLAVVISSFQPAQTSAIDCRLYDVFDPADHLPWWRKPRSGKELFVF